MQENNRSQTLQDFYSSPENSLFGEAVIANVVDCSKSKLQRDRWAGTGIKFVKLNRQVKYRKSDVLAWLDGHKPQQSTSA